jgi:peroxidase
MHACCGTGPFEGNISGCNPKTVCDDENVYIYSYEGNS